MGQYKTDKQLLLIEDDPEITRRLSALAETDLGMPLVSSSDGAEGLDLAIRNEYALVIIDVNLPSLPGFEVCRELRAKKPAQAIVFLTGRAEEIDKVLGLELGADDYVTKPFSPRELAARIKALLRRTIRSEALAEERPTIEVPGLKIDTVSRRVWVDGNNVQLTFVEFELLSLLASHPGRTFERSELLEMVLGYTTGVHDDALTVHFSKLRSKIEADPKNPRYLKTVRGVGYRFAASDESES